MGNNYSDLKQGWKCKCLDQDKTFFAAKIDEFVYFVSVILPFMGKFCQPNQVDPLINNNDSHAFSGQCGGGV